MTSSSLDHPKQNQKVKIILPQCYNINTKNMKNKDHQLTSTAVLGQAHDTCGGIKHLCCYLTLPHIEAKAKSKQTNVVKDILSTWTQSNKRVTLQL